MRPPTIQAIGAISSRSRVGAALRSAASGGRDADRDQTRRDRIGKGARPDPRIGRDAAPHMRRVPSHHRAERDQRQRDDELRPVEAEPG